MSTRNREETQAILDTADLLFSEAQCDEALERMAAEITQDMGDSYPLVLPVMGGAVVFIAAAVLLVASIAGKLAGLHMAGRILRWGRAEAGIIGWLLQTKALIMIIFANVLLDKHIITSETFTALLLMAVASTMLTIPMVSPKLRRMPGLFKREA